MAEYTQLLGAIALLPDGAEVTITVKKEDLMTALERRAGGPETMTTTQAAQIFGYSDERWRRWAAAGRIDGAWQDEVGGPWHLPRTSCEAHYRGLQRRGLRRAETERDTPVTSIHTRLPRGPRKKTAVGGDAR